MKKLIISIWIIVSIILIGCSKQPHEHVYTVKQVASTCVDLGYDEHICSCGHKYKDNYQDVLGHQYDEWKIIQQASETEEGLKERKCNVCEYKETEIIKKSNHIHDYSITVINPTCTQQGYSEYECTCGDKYNDNYQEALGHQYDEWKVIKEASETIEGLKERKCTECGVVEESTIQRKGFYLSENSNVDTIHATTVGAMPCIGDVKVLVFYVDYKNGQPLWDKTKEEVEDVFFSEDGKYDSSLAYSDKDSLRSFYYRSSYGKVDITGTVYEYQTEKEWSAYNRFSRAFDEILEYYINEINWDDYDANNDGYIDGIYVVSKTNYGYSGSSFVEQYYAEVGTKKIAKYCLLNTNILNTLYHETCHMFGPADMYANVNVNPSGLNTACIMDNGQGDLPSPTKFVLGWLDNVTFVDLNNFGKFTLKSYTNYGDVLVVYPDGDSSNKNWFFIEYVTNEGNNNHVSGEYGVRVWKTQMYIDDDYNIINSKVFCSGMPNSPYSYLEDVSYYNIWNSYMQVGDTLTPYTYPSTAYSETFCDIGGSRQYDGLTFSGISITYSDLNDSVATIDVQIENVVDEQQVVKVNVELLTPDKSSKFIDNNTYTPLVLITSEYELKLTEKLTISSKNSDQVYELNVEVIDKNRQLLVSIDNEYIDLMTNKKNWEISISDICSYYGIPVSIDGELKEFDFSNYPSAFSECGETYDHGFNTLTSDGLVYYKISDSIILTIYYDTVKKQLMWSEFNVIKNEVNSTALEIPDLINVSEIKMSDVIKQWTDYNSYFLYLKNVVLCYRDKKLIAYYDVSSEYTQRINFIGINNNSYFIEKGKSCIYKMILDDKKIYFTPIELNLDYQYSFYIRKVIYIKDNQYIFMDLNSVIYRDLDKNITKEYRRKESENKPLFYDLEIYCYDNKYYVFDGYDDLIVREYDEEFNFIKETCILKDIYKSIWGVSDFNITHENGSWNIYFESVSNDNKISFTNSYLIILNDDLEITHYYKYGLSTYRYVCSFARISDKKFICLSYDGYSYIEIK